MTRVFLSPRGRRFARRGGSLAMSFALILALTQTVAAAAPGNDLVSGATPLALDVPVEFNSAEATTSASDPTDCDGSHGSWPGPYYASVGFTNEKVWIYLATGLEDAEAEAEENERIEIEAVPLAQLDELIDRVVDAKTLIGLMLLRTRLQAKG